MMKTTSEIEARIAEIKGLLNAYRQGWVSYDSKHVAELKNELVVLSRNTPRKDK